MSAFAKQLLTWYDASARDLPWRRTQDPYCIWISEIMLQQTTVAAVIPYYEKWMQRYPTVFDVAKASLDDVLKTWEGLGYYSRVKNVHKSAQMICSEFKGVLPQTAEMLRKLPGFGPYTTGAVLSIAFNQREPIIDANVRRIGMRLLAIEGEAVTRHDQAIYEYLDTVMPHERMRYFNQALMELGALLCRSKEPVCLLCPVKSHCAAYAQGIQEIIPSPKKKQIQKLNAAIAVIQKDNKFLIQKRTAPGLLSGMWEFPGGKQESNELIEDTLKREVHEELNIGIQDERFLLKVKHNYTQFSVTLHVFHCATEEEVEETEHRLWVDIDELQTYAMPSGSARIVDFLKAQEEVA